MKNTLINIEVISVIDSTTIFIRKNSLFKITSDNLFSSSLKLMFNK